MQNGGESGGGGNSTQSNHHSVPVAIDPDLISELESQINAPPKLLSQLAGRSSCCIFRVPQSLAEINRKAYQPQIVSIGPYHHGNPKLRMIQEHKGRFLSDLLARPRTPPGSITLCDVLDTVYPLKESIRESYSEALDIDDRKLIEMIVLDGCFIIELFCKVGRLGPAETDDPLFKMAWVLPFLMRDLLRLENQIPYLVLKALFDRCIGNFTCTNTNTTNSSSSIGNNGDEGDQDRPSLAKLALVFFNYMVQRPVQVLGKYYDCEGKHLLDLFRQTYLPPKPELLRHPSKFLQLIQSARKLHLAGVEFKPKKSESFLDIDFKNGILEIPVLTIDDFSSSLFLNFVAYEQCYSDSSKYITTYATFMGCLINTPSDAGLLCDQKVVENYFGTDDEVARFFNNVGKDVVFDIHRSYLSRVFEDVNEYHRNNWHVRWAGFKHTYFDTPWSFISALAAVVLLLFTLVQSFFAAYAYFRPPKNNH
ncbi:UPF0481 protein At3g47200-like isoform X1 [Punica granatum]|uniref:Uncharacterized protein n=3 Tax=Punica granatum TaxID=22663 RepID=A0A2I0JBM6_PUNGR|nr:UPF0481 protein At3g47200-like isoform X1 [Punica granatum]PKI53649.1 hypothetical protein CRG98_025890 [Punica granatum]